LICLTYITDDSLIFYNNWQLRSKEEAIQQKSPVQKKDLFAMASTPFRAIYLDDKADLSIREINEAYIPTGSQALIAVKYSAINPADLRHFYVGMHSFVAGYEWIGPVLAVGSSCPYRVGETLFGLANYGHRRPLHRGAHQDYLLADTLGTYRVPVDMVSAEDDEARKQAWTQVVSWPVAAQTAVDMLFNKLDFAFPGIKGLEKGADPRGRAILIVSHGSVSISSFVAFFIQHAFNPYAN
jgi:NADPH:quinone reductase-like Zn-dependent oxidoreductase